MIDRLKKSNYYQLHDGITNLSLGIGSQLSGLFIKGVTLGAYMYIYEQHRFIEHIPNNAFSIFLLFVGVDFFYYWFHRLAHEIGVLWGSHVVHHQSEEYNLTVALRQSWSQGLFSWVFYLPLAFIGFEPTTFILIAALQTLYQFWIHTKMIHKMPSWFEFIFNTPSHHRVHHGQNPLYIDRNHGGTLIIFDRIFGTFQEELEPVVYGVTDPAKSWNPLWLNVEYWIMWYRNFIHADGIGNKIKTIYKYPGWKANKQDSKEFDPTQIHKFETHITPFLNYYVLIQFSLLLVLSAILLNVLGNMNEKALLAPKILTSIFIVYALCCIALIMENKSYAPIFEVLRLLCFPIALYNLSRYGEVITDWMIVGVGIWCGVSLVLYIYNAVWKIGE